MSTTTVEDVINAAASVATDAAEGRLAPSALERQAVAELSALMLIEPQSGSDLAALQAASARRVLARGGIPTDELAEWLAVQRRRENLDAGTDSPAVEAAPTAEPADGADVPSEAGSSALEPYSAGIAATPADATPEPEQLAADVEPEPSNRRILARGRGLPSDPTVRPL